MAKLAVGFCVTRERNYSSAPIVRVCLFFFLVFFFFFSPFRIDDFPVVRVFYRDLNGGMVSSSRICTVCLHTKELTDLRETALTIVFLTVAIWNFGAARNYTGV